MNKIQEELSILKVTLLRLMPFYGDVLMGITIMENNSIKTAATDGLRIMYNESFMLEHSAEERNFIFMHELLHVMFMHTVRGCGKDARVWNVAADIVVNELLENRISGSLSENGIMIKCPSKAFNSQILKEVSGDSISLPEGAVTTEEIYEILLKADGKNGGNNSENNSENDSGENAGDNRGSNNSGENTGVNRESNNSGSEKQKAELDLRPDLGEGTGGERLRKIKALIKEARAKNSLGRSPVGSYYIPGEMLTLTNDKIPNWKNILRKYVSERQSEDTSYATPERKYIHMDMIVPGQCDADDSLENVWAFVDSSASVSGEQLNGFVRQLCAVSSQFDCRVNIAYWDTCVTDVYRMVSGPKLLSDAKPHHSGGTDVNCIFEYLEAEKIKPDVLLILTDGYCGNLSEKWKNTLLKRKTMIVVNVLPKTFRHLEEIGKITILGEM